MGEQVGEELGHLVSSELISDVDELDGVSQQKEDLRQQNEDSGWLVERSESEDGPDDGDDTSEDQTYVHGSWLVGEGDGEEDDDGPSQESQPVVKLVDWTGESDGLVLEHEGDFVD